MLRIGREVAAGLAAAHDRQLIHRDIKPDNIWIEAGTGRAKILDFGLVRAADNGNDAGLTRTGVVVGTPKYMAPEQAQGESVDHRCDLFSLGSVLYHLATGKAPFSGGNITATLMAVVQKEPEAVDKISPEIDPELARLIMQLLQKNPDDRPASAAEVLQRIADIERQPVTVVIPQATAHDTTPATTIARKAAAEPNSARLLRVGGPRLYFTVALLFLPLCYLFGGTLLRFATNQGLLVVQVDDPNVEISIKQNGVIVQDKTTGREFQLQAVAGEIEVYDRAGNVRLLTEKFTLARGGKAYVTVTLEELAKTKHGQPPAAQATGATPGKPTADQQAFIAAVAKLAPQQQVEAVGERLQLRNPGFDGKLEHVIENGRVVELQFFTDQVTDISPLRALPHLERLYCNGSAADKGRLADLTPLQGMPLTYLNCYNTQISDISPLQGVQLTLLHCAGTQISDLSPLQGMPLTTLLWDVRLYHPADDTLLKFLPLKMTRVYPSDIDIPVAELWKLLAARRQAAEEFMAAAAELPAEKQVEAVRSRLLELTPQNAKVTLGAKVVGNTVTEATLILAGYLPHDLTPLMAFQGLKKLTITGGSDYLDLSPLTFLPLETLTCPERLARKNAPVLKAIKTLKTINGQPPIGSRAKF